jgi:zinc transporter ZupT
MPSMLLTWIIFFSVLGSLGATGAAAMMLFFPDGVRKVLIPCLVSYATGTLLAAAFLGMIPAGLKQAPPVAVTGTVLAGFVLFFILEKVVLWRPSGWPRPVRLLPGCDGSPYARSSTQSCCRRRQLPVFPSQRLRRERAFANPRSSKRPA